MKKIVTLVLVLLYQVSFAQNLIPNPGFELYNNCPGFLDNLSDCSNWLNFGNSSDYYNTCGIGCLSPPNTCFVYQYPHSGNAFAGFITYATPTANYREFIGVILNTPLVAGIKYYVSFYVSNSDKIGLTLASNKICVKGSNVLYSENNPAPLTNSANFFTDSIIADTLNWVQIKGSFIADSAYQYLIIGNFFEDQYTDTLGHGQINHGAYYLIDDVCLGDSALCYNYTGLNEIRSKSGLEINPIPISSYCNIEIANNFFETISIYSSQGSNVLLKKIKDHTKKYTLNLSFLPTGFYLLKIETNKNLIFTKKIIIKH